ncbi:MAG: nucleoside triphosphate pyrophosphohydrolase [Planctomycetota bacterium]|jgi:MazG family protein|nr:nucleoside triphosphate pyrophosphohydrolase [Planctomycetota bacterium]
MSKIEERPVPDEQIRAVTRLVQLVDTLRLHCPWDRKQTIETLTPHLLEECHEFAEAVAKADSENSCEEIGDLLMGAFMVARVADDEGKFNIVQICDRVCDKLIRRHPHVYGEVEVADGDEVLQNWEQIKKEEKANDGEPKSALSGVPVAMPALLRAYRVGQKASNCGFDWPDIAGPMSKIEEEYSELKDAIAEGDQQQMASELGDLLFAITNVARKIGVEPEMALRSTINRFTTRFNYVEEKLGASMASASLEEMDSAWDEAKLKEKA